MKISEFPARSLANVAWGYATSALHHPRLMDVMTPACALRAMEFTSQSISNTSWAYATLAAHRHCSPLFLALRPAIFATVGESSSQDTSNSL